MLRLEDDAGVFLRGNHDHLRGQVLDLPICGDRESKPQDRVVERISIDVSLARIAPVNHALDALEIIAAAYVQILILFRDHGPGVLDAFAGQGMGGQESREGMTARQVSHLFQCCKEVDHLGGIVLTVSGIGDTQFIGLPLVIAAVLKEQQLQPRTGQAGQVRKGLTQYAPDRQSR